MNRRAFLRKATQGAVAAAAFGAGHISLSRADTRQHKMTMDLVCGNIGVSAGQLEAIELAARHGFESVGADGAYLAAVPEDQLAALKSLMNSKGLIFGASGLPVDFRQDDTRFAEGLARLPKVAAGLQRAGVVRITTWLTPCHDKLTYLTNFHQHAARLREVAKICADHNVRLGLEYVGPKTSWASRRYPLIHTLAEMKDLLAEINTHGVGLLLDSWHWWHAGDTTADLLALDARQVVAVDLNDAPVSIPKDQQVDNRRELPCATGVIDLAAFLNALKHIGFDGPVRVEPFNQAVNHMTKEEACAAAAGALRKAFGLIQ
jgi:sugar phosphate isomerase/epimerase